MDAGRRVFLRQAALIGAATGAPRLLATAGEAATLAKTRSGRIAGYRDHGMHAFKGIPYGADTAPRRFRPALRESAWRGVRDATRHGASAPQHGGGRPGN